MDEAREMLITPSIQQVRKEVYLKGSLTNRLPQQPANRKLNKNTLSVTTKRKYCSELLCRMFVH